MAMTQHLTRRRFLQTTALATAGAWFTRCQSAPRKLSANEKLNIGVIGTAHRAGEDIKGVAHENIVALCDIDEIFLAAAKEKFPNAKTYNDFRKLLEQPDIDAVVIGTADHTHGVATAAALHLGKHVYCEKPLTHNGYEARAITQLAADNKHRPTEMGAQTHPSNH